MDVLQINWRSLANNTDDHYCVNMLVGPSVWGIFGVPSACVGLPASTWLLWVLIQRQRQGLTNDVYMLNLTIMDFIFNVALIPISINYFFLRNDVVFKLSQILYCFNISGRPLLMTFICVDCYMAVVFPIAYRKMKNSKHRIVACAMSWGLTLLYGLIFISCKGAFSTSFAVISYALTLPVIVLCDVLILHALRKPDLSGRNQVHPQKQRAMQTITNSLVMTVIAYLPPLVVYSTFHVIPFNSQERMCNLFMPTLIFPMLGSILMPLLYLKNLGSFKNLVECNC